MSAIVMGAVLQCGPQVLRERTVLLAISDNADDYGFAIVSMETIGAKALCNVRTVIRTLQKLERGGWLVVHRNAAKAGKGNVYFVNVPRLGVRLSPKSRKSEWHLSFERILRDKASRDMQAKTMEPTDEADTGANLSPDDGVAGETEEKPVDGDVLHKTLGDIPQGVQVTKRAESGDKWPPTNKEERKNHVEPITAESTPLPPLQGGGPVAGVWAALSTSVPPSTRAAAATAAIRDGARRADERMAERTTNRDSGVRGEWLAPKCAGSTRSVAELALEGVLDQLRKGMLGTRAVGHRLPNLADAFDEWRRYFDTVALADVEAAEDGEGGQLMLVLTASDPRAAAEGFRKYQARLERAMRQYFGLVPQVTWRTREDEAA